MAEPKEGYNSGIYRVVSSGAIDSDGNYVVGGAANVADGFKPSSYNPDLTMSATGEAVAIATGTTRLRIANRGATTEAIRVAFGTDAADALANLTIAAGAATTGLYVPAAAEGGSQSVIVLGMPALAQSIGIGPAVAGDTQLVAVTQGV